MEPKRHRAASLTTRMQVADHIGMDLRAVDGRPGLITRMQVADHLGVHLRTVEGLIASGALPVIRFERAIRIDPRDLAQFLETRKRGESRASPLGDEESATGP